MINLGLDYPVQPPKLNLAPAKWQESAKAMHQMRRIRREKQAISGDVESPLVIFACVVVSTQLGEEMRRDWVGESGVV